MSPPRAPHFLRFARALALASGLGVAGCAPTTGARDTGVADATDVVTDSGYASCVCCTGGAALCCRPTDAAADAVWNPPRPPPGQRFCEAHERPAEAPWGCGMCGPLAPPELAS